MKIQVLNVVGKQNHVEIIEVSTTFLQEQDIQYLVRLHNDSCALSLNTILVFLHVLDWLLLFTNASQHDKQVIFHIAVMLALTTQKVDADREKAAQLHISKYIDLLIAGHYPTHMAEMLKTVNVSQLPYGMGKHLKPVERALIDAWRVFPILMPYPKSGFLTETSLAVAKHNVASVLGYAAHEKTQTLLDFYHLYYTAQMDQTQGNQYKTTVAILEQQDIIHLAHARIKELRDLCPHPPEEVFEVCSGNTGNWSSSDDSYHKEVTCKVCGTVSHYTSSVHTNNRYKYDYDTAVSLPVSEPKK